ncbi:hypothetical protein [Ammoniphilus sp. 3BR4]|uniref:hypothetical protein n=1 Tax=Ammoniphilus sp. 3BR4 TaxID=3158265 RepID=UPI003465B971
MKEELLTILSKPIRDLLQREWVDSKGQRRTVLDSVLEDAGSYGFNAEETLPCLHAAYYVFESTGYPESLDEGQKLSVGFGVAYRSALKLLSYGKYKATRTEAGWMQYERINT